MISLLASYLPIRESLALSSASLPAAQTSETASPSSVSYLGCLSPCFNFPALRWRRDGPDQLAIGQALADEGGFGDLGDTP